METQFDTEVNLYLKNNEPKWKFFNKILLPYINVSPSSENKINDDKILSRRNKISYRNRNIDKALNILNKFDDYELFFFNTNEEL